MIEVVIIHIPAKRLELGARIELCRQLPIALAYTSQSYSASMEMIPDVVYTPCAMSWREKLVI